MAVFTTEVMGEGLGMWQKRFSAFCFPLEGGVAARHDPGPLTRWPYCLTQTLMVVLGRKTYLGASSGGVFVLPSLVFHRDLQKNSLRRVKKNKLHNFQGEEKVSKEVDKLVWLISAFILQNIALCRV